MKGWDMWSPLSAFVSLGSTAMLEHQPRIAEVDQSPLGNGRQMCLSGSDPFRDCS